MKAQMRFQKYMCLAMIIVGALALLYAFCYSTGSLAELGQSLKVAGGGWTSTFRAAEGKYDATLSTDIQWFNDLLMYIGIISILAGVLLYITACNSRRNYYVSNYVAIGVCSGVNIVSAIVAMILNGIWKSRFLNVDFPAWKAYWDGVLEDFKDIPNAQIAVHYSESTIWFDVGFAVYTILIIASVALLLNLVWKMKLMQGEKKLLSGEALAGGVA